MPNVVEYEGMVAFHPGYYVDKITRRANIDIKNLAKDINLTLCQTADLIRGDLDMTDFLATCLETEFDISADTWMKLQMEYDEQISKIELLKKNSGGRELYGPKRKAAIFQGQLWKNSPKRDG